MTKTKILYVVLLIVMAAGVYANSISGDFVYDDKAMILAYDFVKDVKNIPQAFVSATSVYGNVNYYRPLQTVSYITDYFLWGNESGGYHLTNILFHIAAVLSIYMFLLLLFKDNLLAFISSALFAVHPVHSQVVSYIAGRADAMLLVFMLLSFIYYIKYAYVKEKNIHLILSLIFFILSLLVKELALMIPLAIFLFDKYAFKFTQLEKPEGKQNYTPFITIIVIYVAFRIMKMSFFASNAMAPLPFANRIITSPYLVGQYLRLAVAPYDLHIGRALWVARSVLDPRVFVSSGVIAALFYLAYRMRKTSGAIWFGALWFILMIFPSLNVMTPLFYTLSENWAYLPSVGIFLVIAALFLKAYKKIEESSMPQAKYIVTVVLVLFVASMGYTTVKHNLVWRDELSLAENTLKFNPREFKIYNNVGVAYLGKGDLDKAEESFKKCLEIKPDTGMAYFNLYRVYLAKGKRPQALEYLKKARQYDPQRVNIIIEKMGIKD